jgi:hypothetical protein
MTSFAEHLDAYLRLRRALGFKLVEHERLLRTFAAHLDATGAPVLTTELALAWASERDVPAESSVPAMRLLVVRGFARYLIGIDSRTDPARRSDPRAKAPASRPLHLHRRRDRRADDAGQHRDPAAARRGDLRNPDRSDRLDRDADR